MYVKIDFEGSIILKKGDVIIIIGIFVFVMFISITTIVYQSRVEALEVVITQDGNILDRYSLTDSLDEVVRIEVDDHYNEIHIRNGQVWVEHANCLNQVCVKKGKISGAGEAIVCIPHKLVIEIKGREKTVDIMVE